MQANRLLGIAKANHRKATIWQNTDISWLDFVETLKSPVRTQEKYDEFLKMKKTDQDNLKDVGGFTGAKLLDGRRKATNIISRDVVCLDLDNIQPNMTDDILCNDIYFYETFSLFGYFKNEEDAERAIELFGDEIKELFVEKRLENENN